jgi:hypothetical protein
LRETPVFDEHLRERTDSKAMHDHVLIHLFYKNDLDNEAICAIMNLHAR